MGSRFRDLAWFARVPLEEVLKAAVWETLTTFVSSYLVDTLSAESVFASSVLRAPVRHTPPPPPLDIKVLSLTIIR